MTKKMKPLTTAEKKWVEKLEAVLAECPSERIGAYTIGDCEINLYDQSFEKEINSRMDRGDGDFGTVVYHLGCDAAPSIPVPHSFNLRLGGNMRGNHRIIGRQDYIEPNPMSPENLARTARCCVTPRHPERTKPLHHHAVQLDGVLLGYVATRLGGQVFKMAETDDWKHAVTDWNQADPPHVHAILKLLEAQGMLSAASCSV